MYTIKHAAQATGLTPATVRAWERRYGIGTPHRTESGYRLYDDEAVRALTVMAALVVQGWSAREAAEETQRRVPRTAAAGPGPPAPGLGLGRRSNSAAQGSRPSAPAAASDSRAASAGPRVAKSWSISFPAAEDFVEAAARLDPVRLGSILDERFSTASFESVIDGWLMPSLVALGEAWAQGRVSVAGEHLASHTVMRRLAAAYDAASSGTTGPPIVVGLPPGSRHELGILAFAVATRRAGLQATYVGADLPADDWVGATVARLARAVVLSAFVEEDLPALTGVVNRLCAADPGLVIAVGGGLQERAPQRCLRLGHQIGPGALLLATALGATAPPPRSLERVHPRT